MLNPTELWVSTAPNLLSPPQGDLSDGLSPRNHVACFTKPPRTKQTSRLNTLNKNCFECFQNHLFQPQCLFQIK